MKTYVMGTQWGASNEYQQYMFLWRNKNLADCMPGADSEGFQSNPTLYSKFHFHGKFWINLINLGYCIYPKYSHPLFFTLYFSLARPFFFLLAVNICEIAWWVANSEDPD